MMGMAMVSSANEAVIASGTGDRLHRRSRFVAEKTRCGLPVRGVPTYRQRPHSFCLRCWQRPQ
jgi:hypothetical protein